MPIQAKTQPHPISHSSRAANDGVLHRSVFPLLIRVKIAGQAAMTGLTRCRRRCRRCRRRCRRRRRCCRLWRWQQLWHCRWQHLWHCRRCRRRCRRCRRRRLWRWQQLWHCRWQHLWHCRRCRRCRLWRWQQLWHCRRYLRHRRLGRSVTLGAAVAAVVRTITV